jgi:basic membrane lipoprotein Med (substrate-binding protein (PBP1-ABC) superfamily)
MRILMPTLILFATLLTGCSKDGQGTTASKGTEAGEDSASFKVALLTPGPVNDSGWSALAFEGLEAIRTDTGALTSNQVAQGSDIKESMRSYAQKGYQLVLGHGFEYNEPGIQVAKDFPDTVFISSSGSATAKNAGAIRFYLEQSFYLAGVLAANVSKTGTVGMVGGPDVPSIRSTFKAFRAGAEASKPGTKVLEVFTGKNDDVAAARQVAETMIKSGADVLIHQANAAAQGVFTACKDGKAWALGANLNQNDNESGVVIGSATISAKAAFLEVAKLVKEKKFDGNVVQLGMEKGAIDFVYNDKLKSQIPEAALKAVEEAKANILSGKLVAPKDKF